MGAGLARDQEATYMPHSHGQPDYPLPPNPEEAPGHTHLKGLAHTVQLGQKVLVAVAAQQLRPEGRTDGVTQPGPCPAMPRGGGGTWVGRWEALAPALALPQPSSVASGWCLPPLRPWSSQAKGRGCLDDL